MAKDKEHKDFPAEVVLGRERPVTPVMTPDYVGLDGYDGGVISLNWPKGMRRSDCPEYELVLRRVEK